MPRSRSVALAVGKELGERLHPNPTLHGPFLLQGAAEDDVAEEIVDAFGQRSMLRFTSLEQNVKLADDAFRFTPPKGADVLGD